MTDELAEESLRAANLGAKVLADRLYHLPTSSDEDADTVMLAARLLLDQQIVKDRASFSFLAKSLAKSILANRHPTEAVEKVLMEHMLRAYKRGHDDALFNVRLALGLKEYYDER